MKIKKITAIFGVSLGAFPRLPVKRITVLYTAVIPNAAVFLIFIGQPEFKSVVGLAKNPLKRDYETA